MFQIPEDIGNRALQHLGATRIQLPDSFTTPQSKNAAEAGFLYDKCRRAELRANPWTFSARRVVLRTSTLFSGILFPAWSSSVTYNVGDVVSFNVNNQISTFVASSVSFNVIPVNNIGFWHEFFQPGLVGIYVVGTTYYPGEIVGTNNLVFMNISGGPLTTNPMDPLSIGWHQLTGTGLGIVPIAALSPLQFTTASIAANPTLPFKNLFPLPAGYLRPMSQDPKTAGNPYQVSTGGAAYTDFEYEEGYLLATEPGPLVFRFGADIQTVFFMDDLFCELVACRMGVELCEIITQSPQKLVNLKGLYDGYKKEATRLALIEAGSTEMTPDDVNTSRAPTLERPRANQPQVKR